MNLQMRDAETDMPARELFRRFFIHIAYASTAWLVLLLAIEWVALGSVATTINLPIAGLLVLAGCTIAVIL